MKIYYGVGAGGYWGWVGRVCFLGVGYLVGLYLLMRYILFKQQYNSSSMGNQQSSQPQQQCQTEQITQLKVANINFSGYESSPFEYFSEQHIFEQQQLNKIFQQTLSHIPKNFRALNLESQERMKAISAIDRVIKHQRYSPLYYKQCGVKDGKFVDVDDFIKLWDLKLRTEEGWKKLKRKKDLDKNKKSKQATPLPSYQKYQNCVEDYRREFEQLMSFDFIMYSSILQYVYENTELESIIKNRSCSKYLGFMQEFFSKPYLNVNRKIHSIIDFIQKNKIDVLFVQEATEKLCHYLEKRDQGYRFIMSKEVPHDPGISVVIFKEKSFKKAEIGRKSNLKIQQIYADNKLDEEKKKNFLVWGKSAFISIDNFILISAHSKQFSQAVQNDLKLISEKFPTKYVIAGGTFSNCTRNQSSERASSKHVLYPRDKITCYKKRTQMQFQRQKANKIMKNQLNFILYDQRLNLKKKSNAFTNGSSKIQNGIFTIGGEDLTEKLSNQSKKESKQTQPIKGLSFLPNDEHPFDQLIVVKTLKIPKKKKNLDISKQTKRKQREERERLGFETSSSQEQQGDKYAAEESKSDQQDQIY